jgi:hypothetical protein
MKFTSPAVPTTASITTFPVSKSRRASKEATALTDLINFGGTMGLSDTDGETESGTAFAIVRSGERLIANAAEGDVFLTVGGATETLDPKGRLGDSVKSFGSGGTVLGGAALENGIPAEVTGASLATLVLWNSD